VVSPNNTPDGEGESGLYLSTMYQATPTTARAGLVHISAQNRMDTSHKSGWHKGQVPSTKLHLS